MQPEHGQGDDQADQNNTGQPENPLQSLTIKRAVTRCVEFQFKANIVPILTSKKLGTPSGDRGQAEQQEGAPTDQAEHQAATRDDNIEEGDASGEGGTSDQTQTPVAGTNPEKDQPEQKQPTVKPHPVVAGGTSDHATEANL